VVIAGGGVAGLTAALSVARLGRKCLALTGDTLGGLLLSIEKVEGYPGFIDGIPGYDLCPMIQEQAVAAGAQFATGNVERIEKQHGHWHLASGKSKLMARAVIVATGATLRELDVPGAARLFGKGVSQCASCDAPLVRNRTVAVVGGGDSALQEALTLSGFAERVIVLQRDEKLTAQASYRDRVLNSAKIEVRCNAVVEDVLGGDRVTGVRVRETSGNASADLEVAAVFVYIGLRPATAFLHDHVNLDPSGRVPVDAQMRTELPGLFAAGIVRIGAAGRAAAAAGDGATAAVAADNYLTDGAW